MFPVFFTKCVEPAKRNKDGLQWIVHRFPIKDGISIRDVLWIEAMSDRSSTLRMLLAREPILSEPMNRQLH